MIVRAGIALMGVSQPGLEETCLVRQHLIKMVVSTTWIIAPHREYVVAFQGKNVMTIPIRLVLIMIQKYFKYIFCIKNVNLFL